MKIKSLYTLCIQVLLVLWIFVVCGRTIYNYVKLPTQEKAWFFMTETQRRATYYGDVFNIYKELQNEPRLPVYIITQNDLVYFLLRYLLYPQKIYEIKNNYKITKSDYFLLLYNQQDKNITSYTQRTKIDNSYIYKN